MRLKVDCIVGTAVPVIRAAKKATSMIPIVMQYAADAVENGIVTSLARPGGNVTGMSEQFSNLHTKLLEVLHETLPEVTRVAVLWNSDIPTYVRTFSAVQAVAPALGLTIQSLDLRYKDTRESIEELESLLKTAA